ncbi:50S ribosomal protein L10 [Staphylothermus hellenicus]|uniref:Large ribosomal subunit protein uL10 n=1 Tax=Staphylothermus hellenicus (strain DSM 12710 / JCM 10830 / BK20S6-10-b1 / P8) TaxID=591019 RepID=D7D9M4_STAHD|nr:50S ribosomal protein L10 [Staphylothermus hellenicus]ADI32470.1 ribosomal protein L10 [Staphylothermus hellenicus DSM 12710]
MSATAVPRAKRIPQWKIEEVKYLTNLFKSYPVFVIADLTGFPTNQLQKLRKKLSKKVLFRVSKNKLILRALKNAGIDTSKFEEILTGQNLLMFTHMNAFELSLLLDKYKAKTYYKPGEIAQQEIVIPEGNTGLSPGPILSTFSKLKIPTRIQGNSIVITRDTVVAKPGDTISEELASLLQRLDIALKEVKINIKAAYDHGIIISGDQLVLDLEEYKNMVMNAHLDALKIGSEIAWPVPEILELSLNKAFRQALALAAEAGYITPDTAEYVFRTAVMKALALAAEISKYAPDLGLEVPTMQPTTPPEKKEEEKKEEEEEEEETVSEEELAEGLGALFG